MSPVEILLARKSHNRLTFPPPNDQQLDIMFKAALRAPDHASLRPWRYRVYSGHALDRLAEHFVSATLHTTPDLSIEKSEKIRQKPKRAPMVVVASVCVVEHPKVPEIEQHLSAGASVQNLLMAAHFQGIGAIWRTGSLAFNSHLMKLLEFSENESIVGFIYLGTEEGEKRKVKPFEMSDFVTRFDQ